MDYVSGVGSEDIAIDVVWVEGGGEYLYFVKMKVEKDQGEGERHDQVSERYSFFYSFIQ